VNGDKQLDYYQDAAGEWRWTLRDLTNRTRDPNGEIVGASTEGFSSREKAEQNYDIVAGGR
jgi:uncharacterized protein YegP (UPF0339 family)